MDLASPGCECTYIHLTPSGLAALRNAAGCPLSSCRALVAGRVPAEPAVVQAFCRALGVAASEISTQAP